MEQQAHLPGTRRRGTRQYVVLAFVIVLLLAAASALSYYSEEIHLYLALGGWNRGAATRVTEQFIHRLQSGRLPDALALVDSASYQPYSEGGSAVGLEHVDTTTGRGRYRVRFNELIPPGHVEVRPAQLTTADQGGFVVPVRFADGTEGWFVIGRVRGGYRIVGIPTVPGRFHY
jgi:hypothetical protein